MTVTASMVKALRDKTGAGMMDCKTALTETNGDMEQAVDWLRKKGLSKAAKKADRVAAERGGNSAVTVADHRVVHQGVTVLGPTNLPSEVPADASRMFSNNVLALLLHLIRDGKLKIDPADEITREAMAVHNGEVTSARMREVLAATTPAVP